MFYYVVLYVRLAFVLVVLGIESKPCFVLGKCPAPHYTPVSLNTVKCMTSAGIQLSSVTRVDYLTKNLKPVIENSHL